MSSGVGPLVSPGGRCCLVVGGRCLCVAHNFTVTCLPYVALSSVVNTVCVVCSSPFQSFTLLAGLHKACDRWSCLIPVADTRMGALHCWFIQWDGVCTFGFSCKIMLGSWHDLTKILSRYCQTNMSKSWKTRSCQDLSPRGAF